MPSALHWWLHIDPQGPLDLQNPPRMADLRVRAGCLTQSLHLKTWLQSLCGLPRAVLAPVPIGERWKLEGAVDCVARRGYENGACLAMGIGGLGCAFTIFECFILVGFSVELMLEMIETDLCSGARRHGGGRWSRVSQY